MNTAIDPVDERLPAGKLAALGLQHVLVMYAGAVAVPLIVGRALKLSPERGGAADLGRPVLLRHRHADPVAGRHAVVRHQAAGDDGRDLRLGRADGGDRQRQPGPGRRAAAVRRHHRRGRHLDPDRADGQPHAALLSAGGDRHHHRGDRHQPDARGHQLDLRQPGRPDRAGAGRSRCYAKWLADVTSPGSAVPPVPKGLAIVPSRAQPQVRRPRAAWASRRWCWCRSC